MTEPENDEPATEPRQHAAAVAALASTLLAIGGTPRMEPTEIYLTKPMYGPYVPRAEWERPVTQRDRSGRRRDAKHKGRRR